MKKKLISGLESKIRSEMADDARRIKDLDAKVNELSSKLHEFKRELAELEKDLSYTITEHEILSTTPDDRTEKLKRREEAIAKKSALQSYAAAAQAAIDKNKVRLEQMRKEFSMKLRHVIVAALEPVRKEIASDLLKLLDKDQACSEAINKVCDKLLPDVGIVPSDFFMFPADFTGETHPLRMVNIRTQAKHYAESVLKKGISGPAAAWSPGSGLEAAAHTGAIVK